MPKKMELEQHKNGQYVLDGLSERDFNRAIAQIEKQKAKERRKAFRTITPALLRSKNLEEIAKLGNRSDGLPFTRDDLIALEKNRKKHAKKFNKGQAGITLGEIISISKEIDVQRANNKVDDGSGIKQANLNAVKDNLATYRVKASDKNGADYHAVKVRFEQWDEVMHLAETGKKMDYRRAVRHAIKGRISFDCSCGRHQFWYRYLATVGNYCVAPPKEFSPPKIRNPDFTGLACKHVLYVLNKTQSTSWVAQLSRFMEAQATRIGGGSLRKKVIGDKEAKQLKKAKKADINVEKAKKEYAKYQQRQARLGKKLVKDSKEIEYIRKNAAKARKVAEAQTRRADKAEKKLSRSVSMNRDMARFGFDMFRDVNASNNMTEKQLRKAYADKVGLNLTELGKFLDE